jgi:hypothetical protein
MARFGRSSPVLRYWLGHCEGFAVAGGAKGVVAGLIRDGDPHRPAALVVRRHRGRAQTIDVEAIVAVFPQRRTLLVERKRRDRALSLPRISLPRVSISPAISLLRSIQCPQSALSVRFAMTRVSPERLQISWHRRTTSSRTKSARTTSRAAHTTSST